MNDEFKNYYKILGVSQNASSSSIESAVRREFEYANPRQRDLIREAASVLLNAELRDKYDALYNENVSTIERLKQNAMSEADLVTASKMKNNIEQFENKVREIENEETIKEKDPEIKTEEVKLSEELQNDFTSERTSEQEMEKEETKIENISKNDDLIEEPKEPIVDLVEAPDLSTPDNEDVELKDEEAKMDINSDFEQTEIEEKQKSTENQKNKIGIDKKQLLKNVALIGAPLALAAAVNSLALIGITGSIVATVLLAKKGKLKLQKVPKGGKITKVQTSETKLIEQYNEKLETKIREILNKPLLNNQDNYELQIAQLKYKNQLELLDKRIEFKLNKNQKKGHKIFNKLQILALKHQRKQTEEKLQLLDKNKDSLNRKYNEEHELTKKHNSIVETQKRLNEISNQAIGEQDQNEIKNLKEEIDLLNKQKQELINQMVSKKDDIAREQLRRAELEQFKSL